MRMSDSKKTKKQLIAELVQSRQRIADFDAIDITERKLAEKKLKDRNKNLEILYTITQAVHKSLELEDVYKIALDMTTDLENIDMAMIYLVDENSKEAILQVSRNVPEDYIHRAGRIPYPKGFTWKTIIDGKLRFCADVDRDTIIGPAGREVGTKSYASIPISYEGKTVGCINAHSFQKNGFGEDEMILLENVAHQIEVAIKNANQAEALRESEERYRTLVENSYDLIIEVSVDGRFLYLSPNHKYVLGYEPSELMGRNIFEHVHPDDRKAVMENFERTRTIFSNAAGFELRDIMYGNVFQLADPEDLHDLKKKLEIAIREETISGRSTIYRYRHKNGNWLWLESPGMPFVTSTGEIRGVITSRDITERKKMEEELIKAQKLESIGILAGGIAHDFNNILTAILGNISLATFSIKNEDKTIKILKSAEEACHRAKDLTNQLLTFSKGSTPIKVLSSIDRIVKESVSFALTGSNVKCEFSIQEDISPVEIDKGQINQVIQNIIINADHAMPKGGIIKFTAENFTAEHKHYDLLKKGNYIKITIEDKGIGIPIELINKIFDPFFTTKQRGSGLGLATSYSMIKNHGGDITVESELGKGTIFNIYLPASEKSMSSNKQDEKNIVMGKGSILIMDDDIAVSVLLEKLLIRLGYDVELASDGFQAVETYKKAIKSGQIFDVVILDLTVPGGMGGKETMEVLLEVDPDIKAIVTSGYSQDPVMADYKKHGFKNYIAKPFNVDTLSKILDGVINDQDA